MNQRTKTAFMDELLNIEQERVKTAAFLHNVGTKGLELAQRAGQSIRQNVHSIANVAKHETVNAPRNAGRALGAFATPVQSFQHGLQLNRDAYANMSPAQMALQAYSGARGISHIFPKEDPSGAGRSRLHRTLEAAGVQAGGLVTAPFGIAGSLVGTHLGGKAGNLAGRAVDRLRGYRRPPPQWALPQQGA